MTKTVTLTFTPKAERRANRARDNRGLPRVTGGPVFTDVTHVLIHDGFVILRLSDATEYAYRSKDVVRVKEVPNE